MKVSVITTLYNYRRYITECIQSFLQQDFSDSEMIIVDDASTDNPYDVIKPHESKRVRYIRLHENGNYSHAKNVGIRNSKAEILVMLDADDMLTPTGISSRFRKIEEGFDLVHGPCLVLGEDGKLTRAPVWGKYLRTKHYRDIHAQTVMLKKDIHRKIGLYDEELWSSSDFEMWGRIHVNGFKVGYVEEDVAIYRMHPQQMHRSKRKVENLDKITSIVKKKIERRKSDLSGLPMP
ncbi:MAG: glycosyltransferase family 2 protein [Candidatus Thorarchaeota archaeon]